MKIETSELQGAALDWAVAKCEGRTDVRVDEDGELVGQDEFDYSTDWSQGGPIIEREVCTLIKRDGQWQAEVFWPKPPNKNRFCYCVRGPTPLIASMRCYVASRLGAEIEIPEELK